MINVYSNEIYGGLLKNNGHFSHVGKEYHTFSVPAEEQIPPPHKQLVVNGIDEKPNSTSKRMLDNAQQLNLIPVSHTFILFLSVLCFV